MNISLPVCNSQTTPTKQLPAVDLKITHPNVLTAVNSYEQLPTVDLTSSPPVDPLKAVKSSFAVASATKSCAITDFPLIRNALLSGPQTFATSPSSCQSESSPAVDISPAAQVRSRAAANLLADEKKELKYMALFKVGLLSQLFFLMLRFNSTPAFSVKVFFYLASPLH